MLNLNNNNLSFQGRIKPSITISQSISDAKKIIELEKNKKILQRNYDDYWVKQSNKMKKTLDEYNHLSKICKTVDDGIELELNSNPYAVSTEDIISGDRYLYLEENGKKIDSNKEFGYAHGLTMLVDRLKSLYNK